MNSVYALMALSFLRTTLDQAVLVVTSMIPVDFMAKESSVLCHAKCMKEHRERGNVTRSESNDP